MCRHHTTDRKRPAQHWRHLRPVRPSRVRHGVLTVQVCPVLGRGGELHAGPWPVHAAASHGWARHRESLLPRCQVVCPCGCQVTRMYFCDYPKRSSCCFQVVSASQQMSLFPLFYWSVWTVNTLSLKLMSSKGHRTGMSAEASSI